MTVGMGLTPAWKSVKPKTVLNARGYAFTVNAFGYDKCAPLTWGTMHQRPVQSNWVIKGKGFYGASTEKTPWDLSRRVGEFP